MSKPSRRRVLQLLSGAGAGVLLGDLGPTAHGQDAGSSGAAGDPLDVAVVGGGIAGVYAGWRALSGDIAKSAVLQPLAAGRPGKKPAVALFELGGRVGGRLRSAEPPGMPHLRAEIGGMRIPTTHTIVLKLIEELRLELADFAMDGNLYYLRGRRFAAKDWTKPGVLPYDLAEKDRGKRLGELRDESIEHYVPGAGKLDARGWDAVKKTQQVDGRPLYDHGFGNLVLRAKGTEVYRLCMDATGHSVANRSWNAAEMMPWVMSHASPLRKLVTMRKGLELLPQELARRFVQTGGQVHTGHRLRRLEQVRPGKEPLLRLEFAGPDGKPLPAVHARHVILAMPRRALELLEPSSFLFKSPQFRADLETVTPQPVAKVYLGYPRPWWRDLGIRAGSSWTDLPFRNCYYLGTEGEQAGANPDNHNSLLLASYHDDAEVGFWGSYADCMHKGGDKPFLPKAGAPIPDDLQAPAALVTEMNRQLQLAHAPKQPLPEPYLAFYCNWTQAPYGGGWHFWNVHARSWEVIARMRQPVADANVYICGEAWSTDQGWIQGALHTAERVLKEKLGLPQPSWLPADVYLGP